MKLDNLDLTRPSGPQSVAEGSYSGVVCSADLVERDSSYTQDGKRVVVLFRVEIALRGGEKATLFLSPNFSWSKRGKLVPILEKLDAMPEPGETLDLDSLAGVPVRVIVENVEKSGTVYSDIVSIKRTDPQDDGYPDDGVDATDELEEFLAADNDDDDDEIMKLLEG